MASSESKILSAGQLRGLVKVGDALTPGGDGFESFAASGCVAQVDAVLEPMPEADLNDLKMLLGIFGLLPAGMVRGLVGFLEAVGGFRATPGILKLIRIGLRGLVFTLYYAHPPHLEKLGYRVGVFTSDRP